MKNAWEIKTRKFLYFCLDGGILKGLINIKIIIEIMKCSKLFQERFKEICIYLLVFNENIPYSNFTFEAIKATKNVIFNHFFLIEILKNGLIDEVCFIPNLKVSFSPNLIMFLIKEYRSYEIFEALEIYLYSLIIENGEISPNIIDSLNGIPYENKMYLDKAEIREKIENISKIKYKLVEEILEIFQIELDNFHILSVFTKIFLELIVIESDDSKFIKTIVEKNIFEVLIVKLNINYIPLINIILQILAVLSDHFCDLQIKNLFQNSFESYACYVTKLLEHNITFQNKIKIELITSVNKNFLTHNIGIKDKHLLELLLRKKINSSYSLHGDSNKKAKSIKNINNKNNVIQQSFQQTPKLSFLENLIYRYLLPSYKSKLSIINNKEKIYEINEKFLEIDSEIFAFFILLIRDTNIINTDLSLFYQGSHHINFFLIFWKSGKFDEIKSIFKNQAKVLLDEDANSAPNFRKQNLKNSNINGNEIISITINPENPKIFLLKFLIMLTKMSEFISKLLKNIILLNTDNDLEDKGVGKKKNTNINNIFDNQLNDSFLSLSDLCVEISKVESSDNNLINTINELQENAKEVLDMLKIN